MSCRASLIANKIEIKNIHKQTDRICSRHNPFGTPIQLFTVNEKKKNSEKINNAQTELNEHEIDKKNNERKAIGQQ